eukprot:TRINITY_DN113043_c0_g1_i1.p1 TRINITY_DN113043_c0_g1~~TRINITY_DN113043_c0_g1_i1.p1  ORF type:complete len:397 (+),score=51.37 TRINITY_DN113043_c0_g1_i1:101-1192(+)
MNRNAAAEAELADNVHMLLLNPVEQAAESGAETCKAFRAAPAPVALIQLSAAIVAVGTVISHLVQNKIRPPWCYDSLRVWYFLNAALAFFSAISGCVYAWVVTIRTRPWFVHIAGWYMFANTLGLAFMTLHLHGVCTVYDGSGALKKALQSMIIPSLAFSGLAFMLLQGAILLKVEALWAKRAVRLRGMLVTIAVTSSAFLILEVNGVMSGSTAIRALFLSVLLVTSSVVVFTALAVLELRRCQELIRESTMVPEMRDEHIRTLRLHAFTTAAANGTFVLFTVALAFRLVAANGESLSSWAFVITHEFDNACNVLCMVLFSGMTGAARGGGDVLRTIAGAGRAVQQGTSVTTYGRKTTDVELT